MNPVFRFGEYISSLHCSCLCRHVFSWYSDSL